MRENVFFAIFDILYMRYIYMYVCMYFIPESASLSQFLLELKYSSRGETEQTDRERNFMIHFYYNFYLYY